VSLTFLSPSTHPPHPPRPTQTQANLLNNGRGYYVVNVNEANNVPLKSNAGYESVAVGRAQIELAPGCYVPKHDDGHAFYV
jgi:hypothetical protein